MSNNDQIRQKEEAQRRAQEDARNNKGWRNPNEFANDIARKAYEAERNRQKNK